MCLALPEGEVHQCLEGHCFCHECWNRLDPRRCPQCRHWLPRTNRNRAAERAVAALEWRCEQCGLVTTRGAMAAHLLACAQRPAAGSPAGAAPAASGGGAASGGWLAGCGRLVRGLLRRGESALCRRMMAPLRAECQELRAQNQAQHANPNPNPNPNPDQEQGRLPCPSASRSPLTPTPTPTATPTPTPTATRRSRSRTRSSKGLAPAGRSCR